jgi:hypothetical protein
MVAELVCTCEIRPCGIGQVVGWGIGGSGLSKLTWNWWTCGPFSEIKNLLLFWLLQVEVQVSWVYDWVWGKSSLAVPVRMISTQALTTKFGKLILRGDLRDRLVSFHVYITFCCNFALISLSWEKRGRTNTLTYLMWCIRSWLKWSPRLRRSKADGFTCWWHFWGTWSW